MAPDWPPISEEELQRQFAEAVERGRIADATEPRAVAARYDRTTGLLNLDLRNGCFFAVPVALLQDLAGASPDQVAAVEVWDNGAWLHWEELDVDFTVPSLLEGQFGNRRWLEQWGGSGWNAPAPPPPAEEQPEPVRRKKAS
jgi:Protein of unknown function (DUF2442)